MLRCDVGAAAGDEIADVMVSATADDITMYLIDTRSVYVAALVTASKSEFEI